MYTPGAILEFMYIMYTVYHIEINSYGTLFGSGAVCSL